MPRLLRFLAGSRDLLEEVPEDLVQEASLRPGVEPAGRIALDVFGRLDAQHVADEVGEGAGGEVAGGDGLSG